MSKICDRNYEANAMYTVKMVDGIGCCPSCGQPAICHGKPVEYRALFWALCGDTGTSSKSIARHMVTDSLQGVYSGPPSDAGDRRRCIQLLELVPEWIPRLKEMVKYDNSATHSDGFIVNSSGITAYDNSWSKQIPLILQEGKL